MTHTYTDPFATGEDQHARRRYPRLPVRMPAVLEFLPTTGNAPQARLTAIVTTLSCEGIGLIPSPLRQVYGGAGRPTSLHLMLGEQALCLRAQVAWRGQTPQGHTSFGMKLLLALCPQSVRWAYSEWIVEALRSNASPSMVSTPDLDSLS